MDGDEKYLCSECIDDEYLLSQCGEYESVSRCDYCGFTKDDLTFLSIADLADIIGSHIEEYYTMIEKISRPFGEFIFEGISSAEIARDLIPQIMKPDREDSELVDDLMAILGYDRLWVLKEKWPGSSPEEQYGEWEAFKAVIQYDVRYFFGVGEMASQVLGYGSTADVLQLLKSIYELFETLECIKYIQTGTTIFRARSEDRLLDVTNLKCFCAPPPQCATQANRMNPPGIQMFYGALDEETAIDEVYRKTHTYLAQFRVSRDIRLLDLTVSFDLKSVFEQGSRWWNEKSIFLNGFIQDLIKKIDRNNQIHIEYIPTQVVTEYIRCFPVIREIRTDGILYPSSTDKGGCNLALFGNPVHGANDAEWDTPVEFLEFRTARVVTWKSPESPGGSPEQPDR